MKYIYEKIRKLVPDATFCIDNDDYYSIIWLDERPMPTLSEINALDDTIIQAENIIRDIKKEASKRILSLYPEWKQINLLTRWSILNESTYQKQPGDATEIQDIKDHWAFIESIRHHSDALESQVMSAEDPKAIDISKGWPE